MRSATRRSSVAGEAAGLLLVLLAIFGFGFWWLYSSRVASEQQARAFAAEVASRLAVNHDRKFLDVRLGPEARAKYIASWRDRLMNYLQEFGVPAQPTEVAGKVDFTSWFFEPHGTFRVQVKYPNRAAYFDLEVSRGMAMWQIDSLNFIWYPEAQAAATATPVP